MVRLGALGFACVVMLSRPTPADRADGAPPPLPEILANDNRTPAGRLSNGVLSIDLVAAAGEWFPEAVAGPAHRVYAFGEEGGGPLNPGPLLRVPAGTEIRATVRNATAGELIVHGLHDRPGGEGPLAVPAGGMGRVRFRVTAPGTYLYWATTRGAPVLRDRFGMESQLVGALVVDPAGGAPPDHVFVIGIEDDSAALPAQRHLRAAVVNGRSWPNGPMFDVTEGDTVRMRWINASDRLHPMHLHGFYFRVGSRGDIARDTLYGVEAVRLAVTELLLPGQTMALTWIPERPGNWVMHCHMAEHMSPDLRGGPQPAASATHAHNHALDVMSGLVTGWRVAPRDATPRTKVDDVADSARRHLRLLVQSSPRRYGEDPGIGFVQQTGGTVPRADSVAIPGAPLILTRDEPVRITVVNRLAEPTSIHWHGIELNSYFDGVSGWSGDNGRVAPHIAAGDSFDVRFTPPRAGTFIYHSHFDEARQLSSGLYGPLIVLEPGARYDPEADRSWVLGQGGPGEVLRVMLNGTADPIIPLEAGRRYRIRLININPNIPLVFSVLSDSVPIAWRALAKDGADLPPAQATVRPAVQRIGVGETYDFEYTPAGAGDLRIRAVDPGGSEQLSGIVRVLPRR